MDEEVNVKDYKGRYRKIKIVGNRIYFDNQSFVYTLKNLIAINVLYSLRLTREYTKRKNGR